MDMSSKSIKCVPVISKFVFFIAKINFCLFEYLNILRKMIVYVYHNFIECSNVIKGKDQV